MCNVALLDGKHLAALLALGLVVPNTLNQDGSIQMLNFVGPHKIEMLVGAEKRYIAGWNSGTDYTPFLASIPEMALTPISRPQGMACKQAVGVSRNNPG